LLQLLGGNQIKALHGTGAMDAGQQQEQQRPLQYSHATSFVWLNPSIHIGGLRKKLDLKPTCV
jgi:hypothetical protein